MGNGSITVREVRLVRWVIAVRGRGKASKMHR